MMPMPGTEHGKGSVQGRQAARKERLADKLRQNLSRRKAPARAARNEAELRAVGADKAEDAPASDMQRGAAPAPTTNEHES
jgi:hypothetical protein